jgi:hypothetical protein
VIVQVRGSSCSGKSSVVTRLLRDYPPVDKLYEGGWNKLRPKLTAQLLPGDLAVLGGYSATTKTGGLDAFSSGTTQKVWEWLHWHCLRHKHVLFEGLMASLVIGRSEELWRTLQEERAPGLPVVFAFLDTPVNVVLPRLLVRNNGQGPTRQGVNLEDTGRRSWARVQLIRRTFLERGLPVVDLHWQTAYEELVALLYRGGWDPTQPSGPLAGPSPWWYSPAAHQSARGSRTPNRKPELSPSPARTDVFDRLSQGLDVIGQ